MVKLSILVLSLLERNSYGLLRELSYQAQKFNSQVLWLGDNFTMTTGEKRNKLLSISDGEYFCFVDDDDIINPYYLKEIHEALKSNPDLVTFQSFETENERPKRVWRFSENVSRHIREPGLKINNVPVLNCPPNHICVWRKSLVPNNPFPKKTKSEDHDFAQMMYGKAQTAVHLNKILYYYQFNTSISRGRK